MKHFRWFIEDFSFFNWLHSHDHLFIGHVYIIPDMKISLPTAFYYPKCFARILVEFSSENLSEFPAVTYANLSEGDPDYRWWVDGLEKPRCMETSWRDAIYDKRRIHLHGKRLVLVGIIFVLWLSRIDRTHLANCEQKRQPQLTETVTSRELRFIQLRELIEETNSTREAVEWSFRVWSCSQSLWTCTYSSSGSETIEKFPRTTF